MKYYVKLSLACTAILCACAVGKGATFGTNVPVRGVVADIALDESRGRLYIANLSASRIEVMNTSDLSLGSPLAVTRPSTIALSPDNQFLLAGGYDGTLTIFDLTSGTRRDLTVGNPILAIAFGATGPALVVSKGTFLLLTPGTGLTQPIGVATLLSTPLPVPFATFAPEITEVATGVSGDRNTIIILAESPGASAILRYHPGDAAVTVAQTTGTPPLGPRAVSVNYDGSSFTAGWVLFDGNFRVRAQFPHPLGNYRKGGVAFDWSRNSIYADVPASVTEAPFLHVVDTDNLTVRERIQLPQMMAGRSIFSSDQSRIYAVSDDGVMTFPIASFSAAHRVATVQEDVVFIADACNRGVISQNIDVVDLSGGAVDFTLSLPANTPGVHLSQTTGVTPARVRIDVDPTAFQLARGTTTITLALQSAGAVNIAFPARLVVNTRDFNQRGRMINVPGKITEILTDPYRNRLYIVRQDRNLILVYDSATFKQIGTLRTGNTPMGLAMTLDGKYLLAGNDNSQFISVFDLDALTQSDPIQFPAAYPHLIAIANGAIWATARNVGGPPSLFKVDFGSRSAFAPSSLGIYNNLVPDTAALAVTPSKNYIVLSLSDGTMVLWDATANDWVVSRKDMPSLSGAYQALSDTRFLVNNVLFDESLYPIAVFQSTAGSSSGAGMANGAALRSMASGATAAGAIERINLSNLLPFGGTAVAEAPVTSATLQASVPLGQLGQTILPFTRTLAVTGDQSSIILMGQSGIIVLPGGFDAAVAMPSLDSVISNADRTRSVSPGDLILIQGHGLAGSNAAAVGLPLPYALGDACITVNNVPLPLFRVSPTEVMAQLPFSVLGDVPMVAHSAGGVSPIFSLHVEPFAPAIFRNGTAGDETGLATVVRTRNGELVNFTNPIHADETVVIYLAGLGQTSPSAPLGDAAPGAPFALAATVPVVTLGNEELPVSFAGLVPGYVGVYQINAYVPWWIQSSAQTSLSVTQGTATTAVQVRVVAP